jgi:hypothetical protein
MALFRRDPVAVGLPRDVVSRMERFGRFEFDPAGSGIDAGEVWTELQAPLMEFARTDPERFTTELVRAVLPAGGWALYGASRSIWNLLGSDFHHPAYDSVRAAALEFFRANGVPNNRLSANDWQFWNRIRKDDEPWLVGRPRPAPESASIPPLGAGEVREVARITDDRNSNVVYVRALEDGGFIAVVEGRESDTDPSRRRFDWFGAPTLYDLYVRIGEAFQVPTHWVAAELEPFIPLPRPAF